MTTGQERVYVKLSQQLFGGPYGKNGIPGVLITRAALRLKWTALSLFAIGVVRNI